MYSFSELPNQGVTLEPTGVRSESGTSLVAQGLRICLLMQGTWVQSLVWEDSICCGATKPSRGREGSLSAPTTEASAP